MQKNLSFISLGCAKNLVNTEQMIALCREAGHNISSDPEGATVGIINTCGFIDSAKSEAIDEILSLAELKKQGKLQYIIVAGCLSQRYRMEIFTDIPEVDGLIGTGSYTDVVQVIEDVTSGKRAEYFNDIDATDDDGARIITTPSYTSFLKIAEGCNNHCAFCIIPSLRGKYRSRKPDALVKEAKMLAENGVRELIIIAQDTTRYGLDLEEKTTLVDLLKELIPLDFHWIRLHYLYPEAITDDLIDLMAKEKKILPYFDIPIQHCSDHILKAMRRHSTKKELENLFAKIRTKVKHAVIRTSIICGLPNESDDDFEELCGFLKDQKIERAGVFAYSCEEGTEAATMENQVPSEIAEHRVELLVDLQSRIMDGFNESRLGGCVEVLCEGFDPEAGCFVGRSFADSPDIDGKIYFTAAGVIMAGSFVNVRLTSEQDGDLWGEMEE
ncbi:MAG: 30S ribosomal protein S12 methylthiotransferase RimO [Eubacteriales bacterium]